MNVSSLNHCVGMGRWFGVRCRRVLLLLVVVLALGGGWAYGLWRSEPTYWQQRRLFFEQCPAPERMVLAESVEQRILAALSDVSIAAVGEGLGVGDSEGDADLGAEPEGTVFLTIDEINAWIDQRLYDWAANQGSTLPDFITAPMLAIVDGELVIAFLYDSPSMRQVFSVECDMLLEDNQAAIKVLSVSGGRLTIPAVRIISRAVGQVQGQGPEIAQVTARITKAFDGLVFDPILKLGQQKVLLKVLELEPNGARLVFEPDRQPTYAQDNLTF